MNLSQSDYLWGGQYFFYHEMRSDMLLATPFSTLEPEHFYSKVNLTQILLLFPPVRRLHVAPRVKPTSCNTIWNGPCSPFLCSCPTPPYALWCRLTDLKFFTCCTLSPHLSFVSPYNLYGFASSSFCLCFSYLNWMLFLPEYFPWAPNLIKCFLYVSL